MDTDYFPEDFPDGRTHDGFNLDPLGHLDAAQSIVTFGSNQTADRSSSIQALDSYDYPQRATYSLDPLAAFDTRHHATPTTRQPFQQQHAPFPAPASASVQAEIAKDMSTVQPYAGLNPARNELEQYKEEIKTLYASNTLDVVREEINSKYHLKASSKMYKDRIRKWRYNKYVKDAEKAAIVRKQIQRSYEGKGSEFGIRNIHNLQSKLSRYRKQMNLRTDQQALALRATTPPDLICRTPSPKRPLRMPRELESPELVARVTQEYICGMLDSRVWRVTTSNIQVTMGHRKGMRETRVKFASSCDRAMHDLRRKDYTHAFKWLRIGMSMVEATIRSQDPMVLSTICSVLCQFCTSENYRAIAYRVLKHFAAMSTNLLDRSHPFNVFFDSLLHTESTTMGHNLTLGMRVAGDIFTKKIGKSNRVSISSCVYLARSMGDIYQRIDAHLRLTHEMRDTLGSHSERYWYTCLVLMREWNSVKEYQKAAELAQTIFDHTAAANYPQFHCCALIVLARAQKGLGKTILAEKNLREAIAVSAETRGWEDAQTLHYLSRLGDWLDDWGRAEGAASVRTDCENIFVTMFDKHHLEEEERFQSYGFTDASIS